MFAGVVVLIVVWKFSSKECFSASELGKKPDHAPE
jgi:hypothetical protein